MSLTIILSDGKQYRDLELNGNNFVTSKEEVGTKFKELTGEILRNVRINGTSDTEPYEAENLTGTHEFMEVVQSVKYEDKYLFILRDVSKEKLREMKVDARLEYLEMMTEEI